MTAGACGWMVVMLCTATAAFGCARAAPTESRPARVQVGLQIRNLGGLDEFKERWDVAGTLIASWRDPALSYRPRNRGDRDREVAKSTWRPVLTFRNEIDQTKFKNPDIYTEPDGTVIYTQDFNSALSTELDLRKFPFDAQRLPIVVEPAGEDSQRVVLQFDRKLSAVPKARYADLSQWTTIGLTARPDTASLADRSTRGIAFTLAVRRNSRPYIWKFILPLILLVVVSWVTFWLSAEEFKTKDQLNAATATLLIVVAYNLVASNQLPKTNYVTYIDAFLIVSFTFVIIAIGFIVAMHLQKSQDRALKVRRIAAVTLPVSFLLAQVLLFVSFSV
jgi:hypothetical protein